MNGIRLCVDTLTYGVPKWAAKEVAGVGFSAGQWAFDRMNATIHSVSNSRLFNQAYPCGSFPNPSGANLPLLATPCMQGWVSIADDINNWINTASATFAPNRFKVPDCIYERIDQQGNVIGIGLGIRQFITKSLPDSMVKTVLETFWVAPSDANPFRITHLIGPMLLLGAFSYGATKKAIDSSYSSKELFDSSMSLISGKSETVIYKSDVQGVSFVGIQKAGSERCTDALYKLAWDVAYASACAFGAHLTLNYGIFDALQNEAGYTKDEASFATQAIATTLVAMPIAISVAKVAVPIICSKINSLKNYLGLKWTAAAVVVAGVLGTQSQSPFGYEMINYLIQKTGYTSAQALEKLNQGILTVLNIDSNATDDVKNQALAQVKFTIQALGISLVAIPALISTLSTLGDFLDRRCLAVAREDAEGEESLVNVGQIAARLHSGGL
ncbi:MAG: hypothetical protein WCF65_06810 [Parachlamydiaceae bacterium]